MVQTRTLQVCAIVGAMFLLNTVVAQPFNWQWSVADTSTLSSPEVAGMATDALGNSYVFGQYFGTVSFGGTAPITSAGQSDLYIVKYDNTGIAQWATSAGGADFDVAKDIAIDVFGNVFITGYFLSPTASFGPTTHTRVGQRDIYVARLNGSDGSFVWSQRYGSNDFQNGALEHGNAIACDDQGNVYVSGCFRYTLDVPGLVTLQGCSQYYTSFLMKLDASGNGIWSRRTDCSRHWSYGAVEGQQLTIGPAGHLYVGLRARGDTIFYESDTILNRQTSGQTHDGLLAQYDLNGNFNWVRSIGAYGYDDVQALTADTEGNCYIALHREGSYNYLGIPGVDYSGHLGGYKNVILKYTVDGDLLWGTRLGNSTYDHDIEAMMLENEENLMVAGWHQGNFQFDSIVPISSTVGNYGIFLARYDSSSALQEYFTSRYYAPRGFRAMGMDGVGNTYLAGYFQDSLHLPGLPIMDLNSLTSAMFLTRIGDISTRIPFSENEKEVLLYPVPSSGAVTVRSAEAFTEVMVHNAMGALVHSDSFRSSTECTIHLEQAGTYACTILNNGTRIMTRKLVVLR